MVTIAASTGAALNGGRSRCFSWSVGDGSSRDLTSQTVLCATLRRSHDRDIGRSVVAGDTGITRPVGVTRLSGLDGILGLLLRGVGGGSRRAGRAGRVALAAGR